MKLRYLKRNGEKILQYLAHTKGKQEFWKDVETVDNDKPSEKEYKWAQYAVNYRLPESDADSQVIIHAPSEEKAKAHILSLYHDAIINFIKETV